MSTTTPNKLSATEIAILNEWFANFSSSSVSDATNVKDWTTVEKLWLMPRESMRDRRIEFPECFGKLKTLTFLRLDGFEVPTIPPQVLELENLTKLMMNNVGLKTIPKDIDLLENLEGLDLNDNEINYVPPYIESLENLTEIGLSNNNIEVLPDAFEKMSKLRRGFFYGNNITQIPASLAKVAGDMISIEFQDNPIDKEGIPESLKNYLSVNALQYRMPVEIIMEKKKDPQWSAHR